MTSRGMQRSAVLFLSLALVSIPVSLASPPPGGFDAVVKPLLRETCIGCHNRKVSSGDLNLERLLEQADPASPGERSLWEKVEAKIRSGEMPPAGVPRPPQDRVAAVTKWLQNEYLVPRANGTPDPGRVTAHRLNRFEYANTVRDLLGVRLRVSEDFPADPYGYGFDNIGDVLSLSPVLTEKYLKAAEQIANAAVPSAERLKVMSARYTAQAMGQGFQTRVQFVHDFPVDGQYVLHTAWEQGLKAGTIIPPTDVRAKYDMVGPVRLRRRQPLFGTVL